MQATEKLSEEVLTSSKAKGDLDAKRRLLMYISHEIRTPLSIANFGFQLIKNQLEKMDSLLEEEGIGKEDPTATFDSESRLGDDTVMCLMFYYSSYTHTLPNLISYVLTGEKLLLNKFSGRCVKPDNSLERMR